MSVNSCCLFVMIFYQWSALIFFLSTHSDDIRELLKVVKYSEKGSSARKKEEDTFFIDYMEN